MALRRRRFIQISALSTFDGRIEAYHGGNGWRRIRAVSYTHLLALQLFLVKGFKLYSFQLQDPKGPALLFTVTTSLCQDWVICAPAAFLGCGSHLSGSLSEIEPKFFVTRYCHGSPIHYHPKLIGQKLEWFIAEFCDSFDYYDSSHSRRNWFSTNNYNLIEVLMHVLAVICHGYPCNFRLSNKL